MIVRILLAGIFGGLLVFASGFVSHMVFEWSGRTFDTLEHESELRSYFAEKRIAPGIYSFPSPTKDIPPERKEAEWNRLNEEYKKGPSAFLVVQPVGQEMMGPETLGMELLSNVFAALLAAWLVAMAAPIRGFCTRWTMVVVLGVFAWLSLAVSYGIWYRFPWPFIRDELFCSAFEWGVAGIAIAAIVRSRRPS
jgi:hypothetical protein